MDGSSRGNSSDDMFLTNYKISKTLGIGSFGKVKLAEHVPTRQEVAIKIFKLTRVINIMRLLVHPHTIRLYKVMETPTSIYVVMKFAKSGDLFKHIVQKIISAVGYCHQNNIVHRELKPDNLLLDSECNVKIADFGLSNITEHGQLLKTSCGSPSYAAPESCGIVLYAILCCRLPFEGDFGDLRRKVKIGKYVLPSNLSPGPRDLISKIIVVDPTKRITTPEIRQHLWFQACIPCYIAASVPFTMPGAGNIDEEILNKVVIMGFERNQLIESLCSKIENDATLRTTCSWITNFPGLGLKLLAPDRNKCGVKFQSEANPDEVMKEVLKVLQELNLCWEKIRQYNIHCRWIARIPVKHKQMDNNPLLFLINNVIKSSIMVKFEVQLCRISKKGHLLAAPRLNGSQFRFFGPCATFFSLFRVV
ncbi:hypothetical protein P3X46_033384 [Hevea brasiliensis]|uniref:non-specific serine/threonine protein kinase n=1 Tax=Hevea brasiliensis TaxID=3981 RepID=A0ABQ9KJ61_HEVBR|nr:hypothetical protein P3X46_033384 [Hevea brasiliensis]